MKRSPFENPYLLASQIGDWLSNWKLPPRPGRDYAQAPRLRSLAPGEDLFRTRCAPCHLIGPDDGLRRAGPNLTGVMQRRDRAWLARWLAAPDEMLAQKDPVAVQLYGFINKVPMPNMQLAPPEVTALMGYLEAETRPPIPRRGRRSATALSSK